MFILHHDLTVLCNKNLCLIEDFMHMSNPSCKISKCVCKYVLNMSILTKSATLGEIQLMLAHASFCNKSLGKSVTDFSLAGLLEEPSVVSIDAKIDFGNSSKIISIPITKVLLRADIGNLAISKKQRDWVVLNAVLLPSFLT